jgi:hypothetical protein
MRKLTLILIIAALFGAELSAQSSAASNATVVIPEGLFLARNRNLNFGITASPSAPGTITVAPAGAAVGGGGVVAVVGGQSAQFTATSTSNQNVHFWIDLPANGTVQLAGPGTAMAVRDFRVNPTISANCVRYGSGPTPPGPRGQCPSAKSGVLFIFDVGATLEIPAAQTSGVYNGTFNVTITRF